MGRNKTYIDLRTYEGRNKFYKSPEWRAIRVLVLRENPFCVKCIHNGYMKLSIDVDHIIDIKDAPDRAMDFTNLQPLCKSCHAIKTGKKNSGGSEMTAVNLKWKLI